MSPLQIAELRRTDALTDVLPMHRHMVPIADHLLVDRGEYCLDPLRPQGQPAAIPDQRPDVDQESVAFLPQDLSPSDSATVQHVERGIDHTGSKQADPGVDTEDMKGVCWTGTRFQ